MIDQLIAQGGRSDDPLPLRLQKTVKVVTLRDKFICHKPWADLVSDDIHRASYLWVIDSRGRVLIAQRALAMDHNPGLWSTASTGTVVAGQNYRTNIVGEAKEEIRLTGVRFVRWRKMLIMLPNGGSHWVQWFFTKVDRDAADFVVDPVEVEQVRWVEIDWLWEDVKLHPDSYAPAVPIWLPELYRAMKNQEF